MSQNSISPLTRLWMRWKSLSLPWRRKRLVGMDLTGTTYWEFRDALVAGRMRRIAKHPRSRHYSDVAMAPAWLQWLRHTRADAPTLDEQRADVQRQHQLKYLAAEADARWEAKPRVMEAPKDATPEARRLPGAEGAAEGRGREGEEVERQGQQEKEKAKEKKEEENPWKKAAQRGNPSDQWQPQAWAPPGKRR